MKEFSIKRFTASLLFIVMVVAALPVSLFGFTLGVSAEDETVYVLAGSDYQAEGGDSAGSAIINNIIQQMKNAGYSSMDGFLFAGDYSYNTTTVSNINALKNTMLNSGLGLTANDMVWVQGNHDSTAYGASASLINELSPSGANDSDDYGVFVIHHDDYQWSSHVDESVIKQTADNLKSYLDAKHEENYSKPIFVVSHLPLHYSMRTKEGDGMYANYIFDVLNKAGENGLNIIFMFGHNHSNGWDDYLGGSAIFLHKGDKINIAQASKDNFEEKTLYFTYLNAGYTGYYRGVNTGSETDLTMTLFEITDSEVTVRRFSESGLHDLKSKGVTNAYKNETGYSPNTEIIESPQTIELVQTGNTPGNSNSGSTTEPDQGIQGGDASSGPINRPTVSTSGGDWVKIKDAVAGETKYVAATSIEPGEKYVIVGSDYAYAMQRNGSSLSAVSVTINGDTLTSTTALTEWEFSSSSSATIKDGSYYVTYDDGLELSSNSGVSWSINHSEDNKFCIYCTTESGWFPSNRYLYLSRSGQWYGYTYNWSTTRSFSSTVRLYKKVVTQASPAEYAIAEGELVYDLERGATAEEAKAAVMNGIEIYTATDANGTGKTLLDDSAADWTLSDNFDGNTAGEYAVTITYGGKELAVAKVVIPDVPISKVELISDAEGTVLRGANAADATGAKLRVTYEDGTTKEIYVTVGMLTNADGTAVSTEELGTFTGLTLKYNNEVVTNDFTLNVVARAGNNYPDYPNEGAVKVSKTAIYEDENFRQTGVAQVELSVSGIPTKKGSDVIVMLDNSSSMYNNYVNGKRRLDILKESLEKMLEQFQTTGEDGTKPDIRIAVANFNGYYSSGSKYYVENTDHLAGGSVQGGNNPTHNVYTGNGNLDAGAFVDVNTLSTTAFNSISYDSGTNYDYAFDAVYQLGEAITAKNEEDGVERDLFVIFMSDGAPFQYNYFQARSGSDTGTTAARYWNNWLTGTVTEDMFDAGARNDYYNEDGKHWMAEAIKGDTDTMYRVIRKDDDRDTDGDNWIEVNGLGAKMYSIGFCLAVDKEITVDAMDTVIRNIASSSEYYYRADDASTLNTAFTSITSDILYAATNARFVDQMGDAFDLQLKPTVTRTYDGKTYNLEFTPTITVKSYDIYTRQDYLKTDCSLEQIGTRKGTYTVIETVTFKADGTEAYSSLIDGGKTNILRDNVIYASTFTYNDNKDGTSVEIDTLDGKKFSLAAETFYWKIGTVQSSELAISYYVYLTDTMEGEREAGSYATNNFAILYYDNYLGNPSQKETVSPMLAWKAANVRYAFYLVDEQGQVIVNRNGTTGSFANRIAVTRPVIFDYCMLNTATEVSAFQLKTMLAGDVLPEGYDLYDADAKYDVVVLSDNNDIKVGWEIVKGKDMVATTYVTGYTTGNQFSNNTSEHNTGYDYTHTTVWFAVVWKHSTIPDQVVIDYGVPVDIKALANDLFDNNAKLSGVGNSNHNLTSNNAGYTTVKSTLFDTTFTSTYGTATIDISNGTIRYTPANMQMNSYDKFAYEVEYQGNYYYGDITVIPATTIYYEETFVTFTDADPSNDTYGKWNTEGAFAANAIQSEDRPGEVSITDIDHDNLYGYDGINASATTYSLGAAKKVTVNSEIGYHKDNSPYATFTFTGTGFDIISMTNSDSGAIFIDVVGTEKSVHKFVDNYYGYKYENGEWTPAPDAEAAVYQVPVMKIADLPYGTYEVTIWVTYGKYFDHDENGSYSFWLDSIRIYDPAGDVYSNTDTTIKDAYIKDGEAYPQYICIKDAILDPDNITGDTLPGTVFIDGNQDTSSVALYENPGPNNEAYLAPGQSISFKLQANATPVNVQLGAKVAFGGTVDLMISCSTSKETKVRTINTATDMYYSIMSYLTDTDPSENVWQTGTITLINVSTNYAVASLTNIKATFESDKVSGDGGSTSNTSSAARTMNLAQAASEPVRIFMLVDAQVVEDATAVMRELYAPEPTVFTPEVLEYSVTRGFFGYQTVNVITSKDVASLTVNGKSATLVNNSPVFGTLIKLVDSISGKSTASDFNIWTITLKGTSEYDIVAFDENGLSSDPQAAASGSSIDREDIMNYIQSSELYRIMKELAEKRFDPESFEAYVNERLDGLREIITKTSEDVEYVIIEGRIVDRYITETIIDTATGKETVKRIWIAEPAEESGEVEVNAYDENGIGSDSRWASFGFKPSTESDKSFSDLFGRM